MKLYEQENNKGCIIIHMYRLVGHLTSFIKHFYDLNCWLAFDVSYLFCISVALTACTVDTKVINGAVPFPKIYTSVGITNQAIFLSTGKFVCDIPGLYYISSYIRTNQNGFSYHLMKNNVPISTSATTTWSGSIGYSTSVITTAVDIQSNDELYLKAPSSNSIQGSYSCITVIKVKWNYIVY